MARKKYDKDYYQNNREKINARNKTYKLKIRKWFREYKKKLECTKCGETHYACLEFHHVRKNKEKAVSNMVGQGYSKNKIMQEIQKCTVLCANCHRKIHHKD
jgi:hypothetical protein